MTYRNNPALRSTDLLPKAVTAPATTGPTRIIRYTYYAFIFSIPFESVDMGARLYGTIPKMMGILLVLFTILQPRLCLKWPPTAVWCFVAYLYLYLTFGGYWVFAAEDPRLTTLVWERFLTLGQLLVLFWISYNLLRYERVAKGTLLTLVASCIVVAALLVSGVAMDPELAARAATGSLTPSQARLTVGDANPNRTATILSLGIIALSGLAYGRIMKLDRRVQIFSWIGFGFMALALTRTGSRGALVALLVGLLVFLLSRGNVVLKIKIGFAIAVGILVLIMAAYNLDAFRQRWERTLTRGDLAGREVIYPAAVEMIVEEPLIGWGPGRNRLELGSRLAIPERDAHNLYLHMLTEMGILGAIPFFLGFWLCLIAAWRARKTVHGVLPLAMLVLVLAVTMKGTYLYTKFLWIVLAYALASSTYAVLPERSYVSSRTRSGTPGLARMRLDVR